MRLLIIYEALFNAELILPFKVHVIFTYTYYLSPMGQSSSSSWKTAYDPAYEKSRECRDPNCQQRHVFAGFAVPHKHEADPWRQTPHPGWKSTSK